MQGLLGRNFMVSEKISTLCRSRTSSDERVEMVKEAPWKTSRTARKCMVCWDETSRLVRKFRRVPAGLQVMKESKRSKRPPGKHRGLPENAWFIGTKLHG